MRCVASSGVLLGVLSFGVPRDFLPINRKLILPGSTFPYDFALHLPSALY